jgi:hypothetical protein
MVDWFPLTFNTNAFFFLLKIKMVFPMCCLLGLHGFLAISYALRLQDYRLFYFQSSEDNLTTFGNVFSSFGWSIALAMDCL